MLTIKDHTGVFVGSQYNVHLHNTNTRNLLSKMKNVFFHDFLNINNCFLQDFFTISDLSYDLGLTNARTRWLILALPHIYARWQNFRIHDVGIKLDKNFWALKSIRTIKIHFWGQSIFISKIGQIFGKDIPTWEKNVKNLKRSIWWTFKYF